MIATFYIFIAIGLLGWIAGLVVDKTGILYNKKDIYRHDQNKRKFIYINYEPMAKELLPVQVNNDELNKLISDLEIVKDNVRTQSFAGMTNEQIISTLSSNEIEKLDDLNKFLKELEK